MRLHKYYYEHPRARALLEFSALPSRLAVAPHADQTLKYILVEDDCIIGCDGKRILFNRQMRKDYRALKNGLYNKTLLGQIAPPGNELGPLTLPDSEVRQSPWFKRWRELRNLSFDHAYAVRYYCFP